MFPKTKTKMMKKKKQLVRNEIPSSQVALNVAHLSPFGRSRLTRYLRRPVLHPLAGPGPVTFWLFKSIVD